MPRVAALDVSIPRAAMFALAMICCALLCGGCGVFRGIPTHGGGKRFDEEQRVVAGAIRQTLADLDVSELDGKKVQISLECISQDGGGNSTFPGINGINAGLSGNIGTGNVVNVVPSGNGVNLQQDNTSKGGGGNIGFSYNPMLQSSAAAMSSMPDLGYLKASLEMKARHAGLLLLAPGTPDVEITLYVLVDVLGTNRSRTDEFFWNSDKLLASCECTYYAQDAKSGKLIFAARRASAAAAYSETRHLGHDTAIVDRTLHRTTPTSLPVDEPRKPSTQPVIVAKKKPLLDRVLGVF